MFGFSKTSIRQSGSSPQPFPGRSLLAGIFLLVSAGLSPALLAQARAAPQALPADSQMQQICGSREVVAKSRGSKTTYMCKTQSKKAGTSASATGNIKAAGDGGLRADINCSFSDSGGVKTWLGCICTENGDGNCTGFITWCAEQGDEVSGNSGGASCNPGG